MSTLTPDELAVLRHVRNFGPVSVDHIARNTVTYRFVILRHLRELENKGLIRKNITGLYELVDFSEKEE